MGRSVVKLLVAVLSGSMVTLTSSQLPLQSLTVPAERLPRECRLAPARKSASGQPQTIGYPNLTENPWVGTDRPKLRSIRQVVDGPPYWNGPEEWSRLSDGVVEAYRAIYVVATDRVEVNVYAVRFDNPKLAARALLSKVAGAQVMAKGSTVVRVISSGDGECTKRIIAYITSLKALGHEQH